MSLFGGRKRTDCKSSAKLPRWVVCELRNKRADRGDYIGLYGPLYVSVVSRHTTKEFATAEMRAILPRLSSKSALVLWDDECEVWTEWEAE